MNEENPYRSPLTECDGTTTPASMAECGAIWVSLGLLSVLGSAAWRVFWFTVGYVTNPIAFADGGLALVLVGLCLMLVGWIRGR